jgi:hypothetical protein
MGPQQGEGSAHVIFISTLTTAPREIKEGNDPACWVEDVNGRAVRLNSVVRVVAAMAWLSTASFGISCNAA